MGDDALGTVFEASGQEAEVAGTAEQEERAVAEEAGLPVLQLVARQKLAFVVDEVFVVHSRQLAGWLAFLNMFMSLQMLHAIFVVAFAGRAVSELHRNIIVFGHAADRACMDKAFFKRRIPRTAEPFSSLVNRTPVLHRVYDIAAEEEKIIRDRDKGCNFS